MASVGSPDLIRCSGAGASTIRSQARQASLGRCVTITRYWAGITSSRSEVSSPITEHLIKSGLEAMVASVLVAKYGWHLPLYRQAKMLAAQGLDLDRSTLAFCIGFLQHGQFVSAG